MPIISVIIPTYRPCVFLKECLQSLNTQTLSKDKFEIVIVLNGEKEPYYRFVEDIISNFDLDIKFIYTVEKGVSNARNIGLKESVGKYICFIDDDDLVSPSFLQNLFDVSGNNYIVVADFRTFHKDLTHLGYDYVSKAYKNTKNNSLICRRSFLSSSCGKLIPRNIIGNREFNTKFKNSEDAVFMYKISNRIKSIELAKNNTIYYRRIREASASRSKKNLFYRINNFFIVCNSYITTYFHKPQEYSFILLLTRILGTFIHNIRL